MLAAKQMNIERTNGFQLFSCQLRYSMTLFGLLSRIKLIHWSRKVHEIMSTISKNIFQLFMISDLKYYEITILWRFFLLIIVKLNFEVNVLTETLTKRTRQWLNRTMYKFVPGREENMLKEEGDIDLEPEFDDQKT